MADLWQHPQSGTYYFRRGIPAELRALTGRGREWKVSLKTKDREEARGLFLREAQRCEEALANARAQITAGPHQLTPRQVADLGARWLSDRLTDHQVDLDDDTTGYEDEALNLQDISRRTAAGRAKGMRGEVVALLAAERLLVAEDSRTFSLIADELLERKLQFLTICVRRAEGDYRAGLEDEGPKAWKRPSDPRKTMRWAFDEWVKARKPAISTAYEFERYIAEFGEKRLVQEVTAEDVKQFRDGLTAAGLSANYVDKKLSPIRSVFKWMVKEGHASSNPAQGVGVADLKQDRARQKRDGYTRDEARMLLVAARKVEGPIRWLPWVLAATGCRLHEVCQALTSDVAEEDGIYRLKVTDVGDKQGLKTEASRRTVPLHPALIAEGFLEYVEGLPKGGRIFPEATLSKKGTLGGNLGQRHRTWARKMISDPRKVAHSWRHSFKTWAREADIGEEKSDALTGHQQPGRVGRGYGVIPLKTLAAAIAKIDFGAPPKP